MVFQDHHLAAVQDTGQKKKFNRIARSCGKELPRHNPTVKQAVPP
jgi:hypothetical protein